MICILQELMNSTTVVRWICAYKKSDVYMKYEIVKYLQCFIYNTSKYFFQNISDQGIKYLSVIIYQYFIYLNTRQFLILHHSYFFFIIVIVLLNTTTKEYVVYLFGWKHHQRFYLVIIILNFHSHVGDFLVIYRNLTMWHSFLQDNHYYFY